VNCGISHPASEPLDLESRRKVIATLADRDELLPARSERQKLAAAQEVIDFGGRTGLITLRWPNPSIQ
jgi:hypothetical protein